MRVRIVSDLHIDVNDTMEFGFLNNLEETDILCIAGDVAGSKEKEIEFFKELRNHDTEIPVICVGGNHLGYDYMRYRQVYAMLGHDEPLHETKEDCINTLVDNNYDIDYLNNSAVDYGDYIIYGGTMYCDFNLYGGNDNACACKNSAQRWLNDFRYVHTFDKKEKLVRPVTADDYQKWFKLFIKNLKKLLETTEKDIIIVSHFAPSIKSIGNKYLNKPDRFSEPGSSLNGVYASNLEKFIKDNPKIKLWIHGHVHEPFDYNIEQCHVVCEPYGYYGHEQEIEPQKYEGKIIDV